MQHSDPNHLFVYGTLMRGLASSKTRFLNAHARFLGRAQMGGHLYDLGDYPGLTLSEEPEAIVTGHVFTLDDPDLIFSVLDPYEGIDPQAPDRGPYVRRLVAVSLEKRLLPCWTYLYIWPVAEFPRIPSGNYLEYVRQNPRHQQFIKSV